MTIRVHGEDAEALDGGIARGNIRDKCRTVDV